MPNSRRRERLGALIEEILSDLIRQMKDPRVAGLVSVARVQVTPDASVARVFISIMGSEDERKGTIRALEHATGFLRSQLGQQLTIRHVPQLQFTLDRSIEEGDQVLRLINQIDIPPAPPDEDGAPVYDDEDDEDVGDDEDDDKPGSDGSGGARGNAPPRGRRRGR
jgi:ribosome-binding factor A